MSDAADEPNPYAPPETVDAPPPSVAGGDAPLATLSSRFVANLLDGLLYTPTVIPGAIVMGAQGDTQGSLGAIVMGIGVTAFAVYQWYLVATTGQSLAKRWLKIKIVMLDGSPVTFMSGVFVRTWVVAILGAIPYIGGILALADPLMIFSATRRTLHDRMAGTKVVDVSMRF